MFEFTVTRKFNGNEISETFSYKTLDEAIQQKGVWALRQSRYSAIKHIGNIKDTETGKWYICFRGQYIIMR